MIQQVLIGLALIFGFFGCLSDPFIGMLTLMGINIIQPGELYPVFNALHVERVMALLTLVITAMRGVRFRFPPTTRWSIAVFGATVASIPLAFWMSNALDNSEEFAKTIILSVLLVTLARNAERVRTVLITFSILVTYLAATSLIEYFQGNFQFRMGVERAVGLTSASNNPDTLGLTIVTAIPLMFIFTLKGNPSGLRWTVRFMIVICLWALMLTGSRGTVLAMVLTLALMAFLSRRRLLVVPLATVLCLGIWAVLPAQYKARYTSVDHLQNDESYQDRILSWEGGWQMFLHNPLTGIGIGNYSIANGERYWPAKRKVWLQAHSVYFQTLGELGLVGVVAFTGFVIVLFRTNGELRRRRRDADAVWRRWYPLASNLSVVSLLYTGYAYHDLYRSTWYFIAALGGSLWLLPVDSGATAAMPAEHAAEGTTGAGALEAAVSGAQAVSA